MFAEHLVQLTGTMRWKIEPTRGFACNKVKEVVLFETRGRYNSTCHNNHSCKVGRSDVLSSPSRAIKTGGDKEYVVKSDLYRTAGGIDSILEEVDRSEPLLNVRFDSLSVDTGNMGRPGTFVNPVREDSDRILFKFTIMR